MSETRSFLVHAADEDRPHWRSIEGPTPEAAAIAFVEDWSGAHDPDETVRVVVHDADDGREHCYLIDMGEERGEASATPCA